MERLRKVFFVIALVLISIAVLVEVGSLGVLDAGGDGNLGEIVPSSGEVRDAFEDADSEDLNRVQGQDTPPGRAIPAMGFIDGIVLFTTALIGVSLIVRERVQGRVQGVATLIFSLLTLIGGIVAVIAAVAAVMLMVALFLAVPFGTLTYLALFGFFNRSGASAALGLVMALKIGFAICLPLAHPRFLQNRGLVLLIITSFLSNVIISFLHGFVPGFLVSITDGIAAIVVIVLAVIWAVVLLVGSVPAVVKALRVDRV
jgi:hypothetical protein